MSNLVAFELKEPYVLEELQGATISFGPSAQMLDIKKSLTDGNGLIVTDEDSLVATLDVAEILQRAELPAGAEATPVDLVLPQVQQAGPIGVIPQSPPTVAEPQAEAVHADEPETVDEAAQQPQSQAEAQGTDTNNESTTDAPFGR